MTDQQHPIIPQKWQVDAWCKQARAHGADVDSLFVQAYQAGADQELEALLTWLRVQHFANLATDLLAARRPKPTSLKQQALAKLEEMRNGWIADQGEFRLIRCALEQLDD